MPTRPQYSDLVFAHEPYSPLGIEDGVSDTRTQSTKFTARVLFPEIGRGLVCETVWHRSPDTLYSPLGRFEASLPKDVDVSKVTTEDLRYSRFMFGLLAKREDSDGHTILANDQQSFTVFAPKVLSGLPACDDWLCLELALRFVSGLEPVELVNAPLHPTSKQPTCLLDIVQGPLDTTSKQDLRRSHASGVVHLRNE